MVHCVILAGGKGTRLNTTLPKQFIILKDKPIIIHTIEKFLEVEEIGKIYIGINKEYKEYFLRMLNEYLKEYIEKIEVIDGGKERIDTMINVIQKEKNKFSKEDILITHDAVRPFIAKEKILESIQKAKEYGCSTLSVKCIDTIMKVEDNIVSEVLERSNLYRVQTPQTFNVEKLIKAISNLKEEEKETLTDACKIFVLKKYPVYNIEGSYDNIKITTKEDLEIAKILSEKYFKNTIYN